jgi:hypothetical protein
MTTSQEAASQMTDHWLDLGGDAPRPATVTGTLRDKYRDTTQAVIDQIDGDLHYDGSVEQTLRAIGQMRPDSLGKFWLTHYYGSSWNSTSQTTDEFGSTMKVLAEWWLSQDWDDKTDPATAERDTFPDPDWYGFVGTDNGADYAACWANLKWWAENTDIAIPDGVDETIRLLRGAFLAGAPHPDRYVLPDEGWLTTDRGKEFVSEVLKYKRWRFASVFPDPDTYDGGGFANYGDGYCLANLRWWAGNGVVDVADTVRAQWSVWEELGTGRDEDKPHPEYLLWPMQVTIPSVYEWSISGQGQRFARAVMKHKAWNLAQPDAEPEPESSASDRIAELERELEVERRHHREDIEAVERVLKVQARARGWCSEYESVVEDELNPRLHLSIGTARLWLVQRYETYQIRFQRTFTVEADDREAAEAAVADQGRASDSAVAYQVLHHVNPELVDYEEWGVSSYSGGDEGDDGEWSLRDSADCDLYEGTVELVED